MLLFGSNITPRFHEFLLDDISLMNSYKGEELTAIPIPILVLISLGIPIIIIVSLSAFRKSLSLQRRLWDIFCGLLSLCGSQVTQLTITILLKNICGLPRPDLISRCLPSVSVLPFGQLATIEICTNDDLPLLMDGFRSFPSGHLLTVFCAMVLVSLNICGKLQVFDRRGISSHVILVILPLLLACFVACTRISDNRHFLRDVIGGSIIGSTVAIFFYYQYFPSIFNLENCGRAYPPRRYGLATLYNNVEGFWNLEERTSGSFQRRNLNSIESLRKLIEATNIHISPQDLVSTGLSENIDLLNRLSQELNGRYINLDE